MSLMRQFLTGFRNGMKNFGNNIAIIINTVLLFFVYITGVGVTSLISKITRKHFLDLRLKKESYWSDLNLKKKKIEDYYRQF